ncbi:MAG: ABC transporter ATP-binding protein [Halanaerobiaceae bacterium]
MRKKELINQYIKPYIFYLTIGFICILIYGSVNIVVPWLFKFLIDDVLKEQNLGLLNYLVLGAVVAYFIKGIFNYLQIYLLTSLGERVVFDIRNDIYRHLQDLSLRFYERQSTGDLMSRLTNDVAIIQQSVTIGFANLILQPFIIIGIIVFMLYIDWQLALVSFSVLPLVAYAVNIFGKKMRLVSNKIQNRLGIVTSILQETLSAIRIVKAFNMEKEEIRRFKKANKKTLNANMKGVRLKAALLPIIELIVSAGVALFLWFGGRQVLSGNLTTGELVAFLTYVGMLWSPINILSDSYHLLQKAYGAADRIFELIDVEEKVEEVENAVDIPEIDGEVVFDDVSFSYIEGEKVLSNINLKVNPGEMVALVGHSGAGKTTMANLIPRFYDIDNGHIYIDEYDISEVTLQSLRKQIGIVPQETILFKATIADNISYGSEDKTLDDIIAAARQANAHEFILEMTDDYQTEIGERGVSLSGGQRQRIAIARAILKDPRILILDEATSSLDTRSEALVQEALERVMKNRTTFVIAHRLSTIIKADKIIVLSEGKIVEMGTHDNLLEEKKFYYNLYQNQFNNNIQGEIYE